MKNEEVTVNKVLYESLVLDSRTLLKVGMKCNECLEFYECFGEGLYANQQEQVKDILRAFDIEDGNTR